MENFAGIYSVTLLGEEKVSYPLFSGQAGVVLVVGG